MACSKCGRNSEDVCGNPPLCVDCYDIQKKIDEAGDSKPTSMPTGEIKDSGSRRQSQTGSVRDNADNKGRCDLLPLGIVARMIEAPPLDYIEQFKETKRIEYLLQAVKAFADVLNVDIYTLLLDVSHHYKGGALKYGENNWQKGQPLTWYLSSATRHYLEYSRGDRDEPHDRAFVWNVLNAAWTIKHKPELDDIGIKEAEKK